jgi:hypothetical protein
MMKLSIGNTYNKIKCQKLKNFGDYLSSEQLIRNIIDNQRFLCYPEKVVRVYDLNDNMLSILYH